ncbi:g3292 [Coccomyxa viridis]|uniref:G3292 protein n=1 Tax=Coccomyxa viridis TaxID=1274662 RepID=A0ABP1FMG0_9CHLO
MRPSTAGVYGTVAIVLLTNVCHGYDSMPATIGDPRADSLGKSMAQLFLAKEETVPGAKHSMDIFQAIAQEHILQNWAALKEQRLQEVNQYNQKTLVDPTLKYLNETQQEHLKGLQPNITAIEDAVEPDLGYFADPKQNVVKDFFKFATRSGTSAGSVAGPDIIDYAPCLIANTPAGVSVSASAIQVIPQLIAATPYGVTVIPQGINIQPALIQIKPYGLDVSPIGLDIEPILISIRPHLEVVGPEELNVGPSVVEVAGRKLLTGDSIKNRESSHTDLFLQSYQSWIQVIANMATGNEASPQEANSFLAKVFQSSGQHLDAFQQLTAFFEGIINQQGVFNQTQDFQEAMAEFSQLYPVEILQEMLNGSLSNPSFNISSLLPAGLAYTDPQFFHNQASNISSTTQGLLDVLRQQTP